MLARMRSNRNAHTALVGLQNGRTMLKNFLTVSYEVKNASTPFSGIYAREIKTCPFLLEQMFIAALFITVSNHKLPKEMNKQTKKPYPYNAIQLSNHKEQTTSPPMTWMKLKNIMLSERNQMQKTVLDSTMRSSRTGKNSCIV